MSSLPNPDMGMPEVMFLGRSNVGKSSLVNMLCNRKALASTSATPGSMIIIAFIAIVVIITIFSIIAGHTKHFHFFGVNLARDDIQPFYLVDVPGLGYAEVDEGYY